MTRNSGVQSGFRPWLRPIAQAVAGIPVIGGMVFALLRVLASIGPDWLASQIPTIGESMGVGEYRILAAFFWSQ